MLFSRLCTLFALSSLLILPISDPTEAQIVRRFGGGGVQVNAPFVRVNVGAGGGAFVRAPFVGVAGTGRGFLGLRRRLLAQPQYGAPLPNAAPGAQQMPHQSARQPEIADVDALAYPTISQLAAMDDHELVETLRQMMARLHYRLSLLKTGAGWQKHLVLSREVLGSPGAPLEAPQFNAVSSVLPRYHSVQDNPRYVKIYTFPSFAAAYNSLQEVSRRFPIGPEMSVPNGDAPPQFEAPAADPAESDIEERLEILPTPAAAEVPNASRGERSILRRK